MTDLMHIQHSRNGRTLRPSFCSNHVVRDNRMSGSSESRNGHNVHSVKGSVDDSSVTSNVSAAPSDEEQSEPSAAGVVKTSEHRSAGGATSKRRFVFQNREIDEQDLSVSESSGSRKSYSLPKWIDDDSIASSSNVAPYDEERSHKSDSVDSRPDCLPTTFSDNGLIAEPLGTRSKTISSKATAAASDASVILWQRAEDENCHEDQAREKRLQAWIKHYSNTKSSGSKYHATSSRVIISRQASFDNQSIIERGEEVTYKEFLIENNEKEVPWRRSRMPGFHRLVNDTTSESEEEEPCNYDYYFLQGISSDALLRKTVAAVPSSRHQYTTKSERQQCRTVPSSASPDRIIHSASSDGSYSSDESSIAIDPLSSLSCSDQAPGLGYVCGAEAASSMIPCSKCEDPCPCKEHDLQDDAYCSFFPSSVSLPSIDEDGDVEEDPNSTTLCNWTDIQYCSMLLLSHAGNFWNHPSSSSK